MAAVTQNTPPRYNVAGSFRQQFYNVTINASGDTLVVGLQDVTSVMVTLDNALSGIAWSTNTPNPGTTITFTGSGSFPTTCVVEVIGH